MSEAMNYKLPPLPDTPETFQIRIKRGEDPVRQDLFTAEQMQAYAIEAIEAQGVPGGLVDILREAAPILEAVGDRPNTAPTNMRYPIVDELEGFAAMLASAPPAPQAKQCEWTSCPTRVGDKCCNEQASVVQKEPTLTTCNCRWDGKTQVQQCTLHEAHVDAIHEWAERAKTAEAKLLAPQAKPQPLSDEQIQDAVTAAVKGRRLSWLGFKKDEIGSYTVPVLSPSDFQFARAIESAHGITKE